MMASRLASVCAVVDVGLCDAAPDDAPELGRRRVEHDRASRDDLQRLRGRREGRHAPRGDRRQELPDRLRVHADRHEQVVVDRDVGCGCRRRGGQPPETHLARQRGGDDRVDPLLHRRRFVLGRSRHVDVAGTGRGPGPGPDAGEAELRIRLCSRLDLRALEHDDGTQPEHEQGLLHSRPPLITSSAARPRSAPLRSM